MDQNTNKPSLYDDVPLDLLDVRVLHLMPSNEDGSPIVCTLKVVSMQDIENRHFEALSYTWGPQSDKASIKINDQDVSISRNLESFLRQRREEHKSVALWTDAICINQEDADEKNRVIPLMNMIYGFAGSTTIWLGPRSYNSDLAMEWLLSLGSTSPYEKMPMLSRAVVQAFRDILNRSWWSRVWIIQEAVMGGIGRKLGTMTVRCGSKVVQWSTLVIAAARMKAYQDDLRQYFPSIDHILELDSLRESSFEFITYPSQPRDLPHRSLDLVTRYRRFDASDPRDKIFALCGMFSRSPSNLVPGLRPDYRKSVVEAYTAFAAYMMGRGEALEILRHSGSRNMDLPSWVPDWSATPECVPFPLRNTTMYTDVPWWSEPIFERPKNELGVQTNSDAQFVGFKLSAYPRDKAEYDTQRLRRIRRLEMDAEGGGLIKSIDEVPDIFPMMQGMKNSQNDMAGTIEELLQSDKLLYMVFEEGEEANNKGIRSQDPVTQGERVTERQTKRRLARGLRGARAPFRTAGLTRPFVSFEPASMIARLRGVLWDEVDATHDGFVDDVDADWQNATRFMVAVGQCKMMVANSDVKGSPYSTEAEQMKAFWLTLFAGQIAQHGNFTEDNRSNEKMRYDEWLPAIPKSWKPASPPVTVITSGILDGADKSRKWMSVMMDEDDASESQVSSSSPEHDKSVGTRFKHDGILFLPDLQPPDWTEDEKEETTQQFKELAALWHQQPYDLYHRPFCLLNVVPDPYWSTRITEDKLAFTKTARDAWAPIMGFARNTVSDDIPNHTNYVPMDKKDEAEYKRKMIEAEKKQPSIVPKGVLGPEIEKYALGRKFFITKKGYFGLGPKRTRPGDKIAIIHGSAVPFVLRQCNNDDDNVKKVATGGTTAGYVVEEDKQFELVGETYVHGIMNGEAMPHDEADLLTAMFSKKAGAIGRRTETIVLR